MYKINNANRFRIRNVWNNTTTAWHKNVADALDEYTEHGIGRYLTRDGSEMNKIVQFFMFSKKDIRVVEQYVYKFEVQKIVEQVPVIDIEDFRSLYSCGNVKLTIRRFLLIEDENAIVYALDQLPDCFYYDHKHKEYKIKNELLEAHRKKQRERFYPREMYQYVFRRGHVCGIHTHKDGDFHRNIAYKNILKIFEDDQCEEYNIKIKKKHSIKSLLRWGARWEYRDKSWKTSNKCKKQWMKHGV